MVRLLLLPILLVFMVMITAFLVSVDAYHFGKSVLSGRRRGDVGAKKNPTG